MALFNVVLEIKIHAENPIEASKTMREWLEEPYNWVYVVQNTETKKVFSVDLEKNETLEKLNYKQLIEI